MENTMTTTNDKMLDFNAFNRETNQFVSFRAEDMKSKVRLFNAMNQPKYKVSDMINKKIKLKDVILMNVTMEGEDGEQDTGIRSVLIDADGNAYNATSNGIFSSLTNLYMIFGTLHFEDPLEIMISQIPTKRGSTLSITLP
nr:MAG TPA: Single stranded DNA binding protein [Bacteriophage sp.]